MADQFWLQSEGTWSRLGFDPDFAESIKGGWLALELPRPGDMFRLGETFGFLVTASATHDLRAPFGMRVVQANVRAAENPAIAQLSPTGEGWLLEIEMIDATAVC